MFPFPDSRLVKLSKRSTAAEVKVNSQMESELAHHPLFPQANFQPRVDDRVVPSALPQNPPHLHTKTSRVVEDR